MDKKEIRSAIEGILFAMGRSVAVDAMAEALEISKKEVKEAVESLTAEYEKNDRGISITELDGSYQMCTNASVYDYLIKIAKQPKKQVLTDVMLETLSIVAYKQPITKSEIEKIRGVSSDHAVNKLVEYGLVCELGRLEAPGRPILFGTTEEFLRCFGVSSVDELPEPTLVQVEEFRQQAEAEAGYAPGEFEAMQQRDEEGEASDMTESAEGSSEPTEVTEDEYPDENIEIDV